MFGIAAAFMQACHVLLSDGSSPNCLRCSRSVGRRWLLDCIFWLWPDYRQFVLAASASGLWAILELDFSLISSDCLFFWRYEIGRPSDASIVMNLEPVLTVILSVLLLEETFSSGQALVEARFVWPVSFTEKESTA